MSNTKKYKGLTRYRLRKWLEGKSPREIVGRTRASCSCPIAEFIKDFGGYDHVCVHHGMLELPPGYGLEPHIPPKWATEFITLVDASPSKSIQARTALKILDTL